MTNISDERFQELALRAFLNQSTPLEWKELKTVVDTNPYRATELKHLNAEFFRANELISLMAATEATGPKPSPEARERFRLKVSEHFKRRAKENPESATAQPGTKPAIGLWLKRAAIFCLLEAVFIGLIYHYCRVRTHPLIPFSKDMHLVWRLAIPWSILATAVSAFVTYVFPKGK